MLFDNALNKYPSENDLEDDFYDDFNDWNILLVFIYVKKLVGLPPAVIK